MVFLFYAANMKRTTVQETPQMHELTKMGIVLRKQGGINKKFRKKRDCILLQEQLLLRY